MINTKVKIKDNISNYFQSQFDSKGQKFQNYRGLNDLIETKCAMLGMEKEVEEETVAMLDLAIGH